MPTFPSEGRKVTLGSVTEQPLLPVEPNAPFFLTHTELGWDVARVVKRAVWLPTLKPMAIQGGLFGAKSGKQEGDKPIHGPAVDRMRRRKIPRVVLEAELGEYLVEYDCRGPRSKRKGVYFCDRWEHPEVIAGEYSPTWDEAGYDEWRLTLVERGLIQPPHPVVLERIRERLRGHLVRLGALAESPSIKRRIADEQDRLKVAEKAEVIRTEAAA